MSATTNWAGNITFAAAQLVRPTSVVQLQELVASSSRVRALGTGHSFSPIADTTGTLVSLSELPGAIEIDEQAMTVRVGAAVRFGELAAALHERGLALHNMGSLPHISVAGACATGTHGSGVTNGNLASAVVGLEMVRPDGSLVTMGQDDPEFLGSVIALGLLGIVTTLTLSVVPAFSVRQWVYDRIPFDAVVENFDEVIRSAYSVSPFLTWRDDYFSTTWLKKRSDEPDAAGPDPDWLGGRLADAQRHCIEGMPVENATRQLGVEGPWHERLPHFRMEFTPSNGDELQSEYFVPAEAGAAALQALAGVREHIGPLVQISEIRTIAADSLWMSPAYERDCVALHFTWVPDTPAVLSALEFLEKAIAPFDARPHWGKVFAMDVADVRRLTPRIGDFESLVRRHDPTGKLSNAFVRSFLELD